MAIFFFVIEALVAGQKGENIKATKRPPSVICIQSIFGLLLSSGLFTVKCAKTMLFSALVDVVRLSFAHSRLVPHVLISFERCLFNFTTCVSIAHTTPLYLEEGVCVCGGGICVMKQDKLFCPFFKKIK